MLGEELAQMQDPIAWSFREGEFPPVGIALPLQTCPNLRAGWKLSEVLIDNADTEFAFPDNEQPRYDAFFQENYDKHGFSKNDDKLMLIRNPTDFTDIGQLKLQTRPTKYSKTLFFKEYFRQNENSKRTAIETLVRKEGVCTFSSNLCMHATIVTADERILFVRRKPKVAYSAGRWAASVEENALPDDLKWSAPALHWGQRLLQEELSVGPDDYENNELRALAVFLETDVMNCSLCSVMPLKLNSAELTSLIDFPTADPHDHEFDQFCFLDFNESLREFADPTFEPRHPTTDYRLLLTYMHLFGRPQTIRQLSQIRPKQPKHGEPQIHTVPAQSRTDAKIKWQAHAAALVNRYPERSNKEIAAEVGVHPGQLSRSELFQQAAALARSTKFERPKGYVKTDPNTGQRAGIEAYDEDGDNDR